MLGTTERPCPPRGGTQAAYTPARAADTPRAPTVTVTASPAIIEIVG
jgi:hypothetical protein